jgi:3-isopropylmalate/(R)-2-methylmalate dehydratase small subunit
MRSFTTHTGTAVPLRRSNVDTDQIIPAVYLKRITRTGFADGLFRAWRDAEEGFVLNNPGYAGASILVAGPEFGVGSSREHAVWALSDWGMRAVVAPSFGDIFAGNAVKGGLLPVELPAAVIARLWDRIEADPTQPMTVDLVEKRVSIGVSSWAFAVDDGVRRRMLDGLDDIALTLRQRGKIESFEGQRYPFYPVVA